jgi:hypothetical protein
VQHSSATAAKGSTIWLSAWESGVGVGGGGTLVLDTGPHVHHITSHQALPPPTLAVYSLTAWIMKGMANSMSPFFHASSMASPGLTCS